MSTRGLRKVIQEEMGSSLRRAIVRAVHGDTVSVQVGGSPKYLRGLPVIGGVDNVVVGDTVLLLEADGRIYAEATKAKAGIRYGNKSGASVAAVMGPHTHLASSSGGVLSSYVRVDDVDTITAQHSFSPPSAQAPFLLGGHAQSQVVVGLRADQLNKSVLAGSGLAGGGVLTADRTLTVDLTHVFNWSGLHTFGAGIDVVSAVEFQSAGGITTLSGNLTIAPAGDVVFDPTGNDLLPSIPYDLNVGSLSKKYLTLHCAELWVETLVAQDTIATIGGRILVGPTTVLTLDLSDDIEETTLTVKHNEMAVGDRVYMEAAGKVEFMSIDGGPGGGAGAYTYTVARDLDGSGRNSWYAGDAVFNTGATGEGFIDLYSVHGVKAGTEYGPTIVGNVRLSTTYNDWAEHWAVGNLDGIYGYGTTTYGLAAGKFADNCAWVSIDATNGFRVMYGATSPYALAQWDMSGNVLVGRTGVGQSNVYISAGKLELRNNTTAAITLASNGAVIIDKYGDMFFSAADGLLLLGPNCEINDGGWWSLRRQKATITGAFHQEAGRWLGTRRLVVEEWGTNKVKNPTFGGSVLTSWSVISAATRSAETDYPYICDACMKIVAPTDYDGVRTTFTLVPATTYHLSLYMRSDSDVEVAVQLYDEDASGEIKREYKDLVAGQGWTLYEYTFTTHSTHTHYALQVWAALGDSGTWYMDAIQIEQRGYRTSITSGDLDWCAWTGTPHASDSSRTATTVSIPTDGALEIANGSIALWVHIDGEPDVYRTYFSHADGSNYNRLQFYYDEIQNKYYLRTANNAGTLTVIGTQAALGGGWHHIVCTWDLASTTLKLYIDGTLDASSTSANLPSVLQATLHIGSWKGTAQWSDAGIGEIATFGKGLSAAEVAAICVLQRPLVDMGAAGGPGIYILDGKFRMASSLTGTRIELDETGLVFIDGSGNTLIDLDATDASFTLKSAVSGARIEIDPTEIAGYNSSGTKQFYLRASDGKAYTAGGKFVMEETGVWLEGTTSQAQQRQFRYYYNDSGTFRRLGYHAGVYGVTEGESFMWFISTREAGVPWGSGARTVIDAYDYVPASDLEAFVDLRSQYEIVGIGDNIALCINGSPTATMKGGGEGVFSFTNAATVPTSNYASGHIVYAQGGALKGRGSSGTVTTIAAAAPRCPTCGRDFVLEWRNEEQGTHLQVCVWCLAKVLTEAGVDVGKFVLKATGQAQVRKVATQPAMGESRPRHLM